MGAYLRSTHGRGKRSKAGTKQPENMTQEKIMKTGRFVAKDMDGYISHFPDDVQQILEKIRVTIRKAAPRAGEKIGYGIPTFTLNGNLVHFAAFKKHIGFYPTASGIAQFKQ